MAASEGVEHRCFIGGLAWATNERDLKAAFMPFGEIFEAKIINDRETGRSRGFGFVTFSSEQSMRDAIEGMNGKELGGRRITVNEAWPRNSGGRGGCGQRRNGGGGSGNSDRSIPRSGMNHRTADDRFARCFGEFPGQHHNGRENLNRRGPWSDDPFARIFGEFPSFGDPFQVFGEFPPYHFPGEASTHASQRPHKAAPIEYQLTCNLADLYKGTTKKMKISRELLDSSGRRTVVQEILAVDIKPGWKKGTKITFAEKGNEAPHVIPADIVFIIDEKPHDQFTREGNDLVMTQKISLAEDWTRYTVHVTTLDGRNLTVPIKSVVKPGYEEVVPGEGMPIPKDPCRKGNLRIKFNINFPSGAETGN